MRNLTVFVTVLSLGFILSGCTSDEPGTTPFIILRKGKDLITDGAVVSPGGAMRFGVSATGGGGVITNLVVKRIADGKEITEADYGIYLSTGGLDTTLTYTRGYSEKERWTFFIMNSYRDTASVSLTVFKGTGSAYGEINYYSSVTIGFQENRAYPQFLDINTGTAYTSETVRGNESLIDISVFWYITSGKSSPTLVCPAYSSAQTYYPQFASWTVKNQTLFDYYTSDNNLITPFQFDNVKNDSLLISAYRPQSVSGLSKFAYTGKIVPFKTSEGKYGLLKIIHADEQVNGSIELAVKIQK